MPIKKSEISYKVDLSKEMKEKGVTGVENRTKAAEAAGEVALSGIYEAVSQEMSPVNRMRGFKGLSEEYKKFKRKQGKGSKANLELTGSMLNSLSVKANSRGFTIEIEDDGELEKSYNHNVGDTLPRRQFLPDDVRGQKLKPGIRKAYLKMLEEYKNAKK